MGTVLTEVFLLVLTMLFLIGVIPLSACGEDETMIIFEIDKFAGAVRMNL